MSVDILYRFFQNVERETNKTVRFNVDQDEYEDRIDYYHWARFAGGYKDNKRDRKERVKYKRKLGLY